MTDTILTIIIGLLSGVNIFQLVFYRATKRKYEAEARKVDIEAAHGQLNLEQDQSDYINNQLTKLQQDFESLYDRYKTSMTEHLQEISDKCEEIVKLKMQLNQYKPLRCYNQECLSRQSEPTECEHCTTNKNKQL